MPVRHALDVMHIKKNIVESIMKFMFGEKDFAKSRRDLEETRQQIELWLRPRANWKQFFKPHAPYVLMDAGKNLRGGGECNRHTYNVRKCSSQAFKEIRVHGTQVPQLPLFSVANHTRGHHNIVATSAKNCID